MIEDGELDGHEGLFSKLPYYKLFMIVLGSITCLKGYKNFLFSGGEDGNILVWKLKDWGLVHKIAAHAKAVSDIEIHSSGRIMISFGKDMKLNVWNLLNLQKTFTRKFSYGIFFFHFKKKTKYFFKKEIFKAIFNRKEDLIILMGEKKVHLLKIETNKMVKVIVNEQKLHDFLIYGDKYLIAGDEIGEIYIWDISISEEKDEENKETEEQDISYIKFKAHEKRVKQIKLVNFDSLDFLVTCSSDGVIKIWDVLFLLQKGQEIIGKQDLGDKVESIFKIDSRERITCMEVSANKLEEKNEENKEEIIQATIKEKKGKAQIKEGMKKNVKNAMKKTRKDAKKIKKHKNDVRKKNHKIIKGESKKK